MYLAWFDKSERLTTEHTSMMVNNSLQQINNGYNRETKQQLHRINKIKLN